MSMSCEQFGACDCIELPPEIIEPENITVWIREPRLGDLQFDRAVLIFLFLTVVSTLFSITILMIREMDLNTIITPQNSNIWYEDDSDSEEDTIEKLIDDEYDDLDEYDAETAVTDYEESPMAISPLGLIKYGDNSVSDYRLASKASASAATGKHQSYPF